MTTTPLPDNAIPPHCTITSCWAEDVHEMKDREGRVIAHYCPAHRAEVVALRVYPPALSVEIPSLELDIMLEVANVD